ncbi:MAG: SEC-C domain-containing protein [Bacteroidales bacterium]|nr:SEC-C domain-containing protein [Bacteroidales bacterium]
MKERTILNILKGFQKVQLEDLCSLLGNDLSPRLRKSQLADQLALYLKEQPHRWLSCLMERDILLLRRLVHAGPDKVQYMEFADYPSILEVSGLVDFDDSDENYHKVWIRREVYDIVAPHVEQAFRKGKSSGRFELEQAGLGLLNLYGILPTEVFVEHLVDWYEESHGDATEELIDVLQQSPLVKLCRYTDQHGDYMCSPCVTHPEELFDFRLQIPDNDSWKPFSSQDILEAGAGAPYFTVAMKTPEGRRLDDALRRLGYDGFGLVLAEHDIWAEAQFPVDNEALFSALDRFPGTGVSERDCSDCFQAIIDYANRAPKWALNGFSAVEKDYLVLSPPDEWQETEEGHVSEAPAWEMPAPTISEGYTDLIEKDEALERLSALMPEGFPFGLAIPHVAPDDPCPCGSGLRYGHCHGKVLN